MRISRPTLLVAITLGFFLLAYFPVIEILVKKWASLEEYSHAFLTLPVIAFIAWDKRQKFAEDSGKSSLFGLLIIVFAIPIYLFSLLTQVHTLISLSMLITIMGMLIYLLGFRSIVHLSTPLILLAALIPIPEQLFIQLTFPLQLKVSQASEVFVRLIGVPIFREGNVMNMPDKSFEVVEACSGLRSMITLLTLSIIIGHFSVQKNVSKAILFFTSIPIAILVNIFRVVTLILLYHYFKIDISEGPLHTLLGVAVFGLALSLLLFLQKLLSLWEQKITRNI